MPEQLRSLLVILAIATTIFIVFKGSATKLLSEKNEFQKRRNLWFGITLAVFLSYDFWIFIFITSVLLLVASINDKNKVGLVLFILLAVPMIRNEIPGIAGIRYLFDLEYFRLISLVVIVPALIQEINRNSLHYFYDSRPDKYLYLYLALNIVLIFYAGSMTGTMRSAFLFILDVVAPYAFASRLIKDTPCLRAAMASYVIGALIVASVGILEFTKSWLLYSSLEHSLGVNWSLGSYLKRGETLRAMATAGQAIPFGYAMAVGFCILLGLRRSFPNKPLWLAALGILLLGLISSYSRGPWLGAISGFLVFTLTGPHKLKNFGRLAIASVLLGAVFVISPLGDKIFESVTVESGNYDYRQRLLEVSIGVMMANPFFGAWDSVYSTAMQELKQGQGIIDIVNTYVAIALRCGLIGLFLFVGFFFSAVQKLRKRMNLLPVKDNEDFDMGRGLLSAMACILVTIFTVSSITIVPVIYYLMAGLLVAYSRLEVTQPVKDPTTATMKSPPFQAKNQLSGYATKS